MLNLEPKSKHAIRVHEKIAIQQELLRSMRLHQKHAYRGRIAAEFDIYPTGKNPPHLHTVMKNILDVLSKPEPASGIRRKGLVYQDDRQIAYLSVSYHLGQQMKGIHASFAPLGHFLQDLSLAADIITEHSYDHSGVYDVIRELGEIDVDDDDRLEIHRELLGQRSFYREHLSEELYESVIQMYRQQMQESFLRLSKLGVRDAHTFYSAAGILAADRNGFPGVEEILREQSATLANWLARSPIKMQLPRIPTRDGDTKPFKRSLRAAIQAYKARFPVLQPLYTPVALEVIYKPPLASEGFAKDLDNIMRIILPIFHEEFKPPVSMLSMADLDRLPSGEMSDWIRQRIADLPKSVPYSVCRYDILEVPRPDGDTGDGFVSVGISGGRLGGLSLWNRIDKIIDGWHDHLAYSQW